MDDVADLAEDESVKVVFVEELVLGLVVIVLVTSQLVALLLLGEMLGEVLGQNLDDRVHLFFIESTLAHELDALGERAHQLGQDLLLGFRVDGLDQVVTNVAPHLAHVLLALDLSTFEQMWHRFGGSCANAIVEVELEERNHELGDLLGIGGEALLELLGVADKHGACSCLLFETGGLDTEALLVSNSNKLPILFVGDFLGFVLCR